MNEQEKFISNWAILNRHLLEWTKVTETSLKYFEGRNFERADYRVFFNLLSRSHINISSASEAFKKTLHNSKYKFALFTLIRPLLSDTLNLLYLSEGVLENDTGEFDISKFEKRYNETSSAYFTKLESHLNDQVKSGHISADKRKDQINKEMEFFPEFFERTGVPKKNKPLFTPKLARNLVQENRFIDKDLLYTIYSHYSQYEHHGIKTESLMLSGYNDFETLIYSFDNIMQGQNIILSHLKVDMQILTQFQNLTSKFYDSFPDHFQH